MKKILNFLENNIQWLAIALGVLFVLYIGWVYVLQNPAKIQAVPGDNASIVTPGSVDDYVKEIADQLNDKMRASGDLPMPPFQSQAPEVEASLYPAKTPTGMGEPKPDVVAMAARKWNSTVSNVGSVSSHNPGPAIAVTALPKTPPLQYLDTEFVRTVSQDLDSTGQNVVKTDKDVVTTFWRLPAAPLNAEYAKTLGNKIPANNQQTAPLYAELIRQEMISPNTWSPEATLPHLSPGAAASPVAWPPPTPAAEQGYDLWARNNSATILAPGFFNVAYLNRPPLNWLAYDDYEKSKISPPAPAASGAPGAAAAAAPMVVPAHAPAGPMMIPLQNGMFNAAKGPDMVVWLMDDSALPGHTYRYKVRYVLRNPLYLQINVVSPQSLADQFGLASPDSNWSDAVTIPGKTRFWVAPGGRQPVMAAARQRLQTIFDVYSWHDGLWRYQPFVSEPGDEIGSTVQDKGDFTSHWTYLELTYDNAGSPKAGLVVNDANGSVSSRDIGGDEASTEYKGFMKDYNNQPPTPGDPAQRRRRPPRRRQRRAMGEMGGDGARGESRGVAGAGKEPTAVRLDGTQRRSPWAFGE